MPTPARRSWLLILGGAVFAALGVALLWGGVLLAGAGGSWYYLLAGAALIATGVLLALRRPLALWLHAALTAATLLWSLGETGLDWWSLAVRGDLPFVLGLVLVTPWVTRRLQGRPLPGASATRPSVERRAARRDRRWRVGHWGGGRGVLGSALLAFLAVGVVSWFFDPFRIDGERPAARAAPAAAPTVPPGEWHAYGRTGLGQRYSPLTLITPENAKELEVAWTFHTGDRRGRPGDPQETTFEVTPLKVDDRLFLCTPHQQVIALDATTGRELWRYDPKIRDRLALQHLTCRGVSYHPAPARTPASTAHPASAAASSPDPGEEADAAAAAGSPEAASTPARDEAGRPDHRAADPPADLPVAAEDATRTTEDCPAKLYLPTADGRVVALDPATGAVCRRFGGGTGQIDLWRHMPTGRAGGYYSTSPIAVGAGLLIIGGSVLDNVSTTQPSGVIRAYDADSGALVWNWDPAHPDRSAPLGAGETYAPSTPNAWSILSVDTALGLVYVPLGNEPPDQWGGRRSAAGERFGSSVVALDLASGELRWRFQTVHHDLWDYDVPSQPSLVDLTVDGRTVPALVQPTKQGEIFVLDRRSGEALLPVHEVPAPQGAADGDRTAPTQPVSRISFAPPPLRGADMWGATLVDQLWCRLRLKRLRYDGRYTPPSLQGSIVHPGNFGVFNWGSVAVDPARQVAFTAPAYLAFVSQLLPRPDATSLAVHERPPEGSLPALNENFGAPYAVRLQPFTSPLGLPCQRPPWGYVAGVDLADGRIVWRHRNGTVRDRSPLPLPFRMGVPTLGGPIATAGGVAFLTGTLDRYIRAYDVSTGRQVWRHRLPAGGQATPMTYLGRDGRQYVLAVAGGHGSLGTKAGDAVIAYALPRH
jgi:quinoprotein glucose dehydrogenase